MRSFTYPKIYKNKTPEKREAESIEKKFTYLRNDHYC
jgi:hypothetical protein